MMPQIPDEKKLSLVRNYIYEIVLCGLVASVVFLFHMVFSFAKDKEQYLLNDRTELMRAINNNTKVMEASQEQNKTVLLFLQQKANEK